MLVSYLVIDKMGNFDTLTVKHIPGQHDKKELCKLVRNKSIDTCITSTITTCIKTSDLQELTSYMIETSKQESRIKRMSEKSDTDFDQFLIESGKLDGMKKRLQSIVFDYSIRYGQRLIEVIEKSVNDNLRKLLPTNELNELYNDGTTKVSRNLYKVVR